jgi:hypothetical protein
MKILRTGHGYSIHNYIVELTDQEKDWCNARIITACDNHGRCDDEQWQRVVDGAHPGHFGGTVRRASGIAYVSVYVD